MGLVQPISFKEFHVHNELYNDIMDIMAVSLHPNIANLLI
jgi:hypothetical protein